MSVSTYYNIPTFSPANYQDNDTYGEDCTIEMTSRGTTIASVGAPKVTRADSVPVGANDMQVLNISVLSGGLKFAWTGTGGVPNSAYYLTFPLTLANGNVINRTVLVMVPSYVG